jgi:hypothetical protein
MRHCAATVLTPVFCTLLFTSFTTAQECARLSPFTEVTVIGDSAEVVFEGKRYELVAIEGIATAEILAWCRENHLKRWDDRFEMGLMEIMSGMNMKLADAVQIELRAKSDGALRPVKRAPITLKLIREAAKR